MSLHATTLLRAHSPDRRRRFGLSTLVLSLLSLLLLPSVVFAQTPPAAQGKNATTTEDTPVTIDTGVTYDPLYEIQQTNAGPNSPIHGAMSAGPIINNKYTINYTPGTNRVDGVSFQYHFCMNIPPNLCGSPATVNVSITAVNDAPTATNDTITTSEDTVINISVLTNDSAGPADENQTLSLVNLTTPTNGTAVIAGSQVTYTPAPDYCGSDSITYQAKDSGNLLSNIATVSITITCVNDKPVANNDTTTVTEDSTNNLIDVLANDSIGPANEAPQTLSVFDIVTLPTKGTVVNNGANVTYTPNPNFCGSDSFEYRNQDNGTGLPISAKARVDVTVTCVVDKPVLTIANVSAVVNHTVTANVVLTSPDKDVSGVNFDLDYVCLLNPVVDPTTTPPAPPFFVQIQDDGNLLGFLIGDQSGNGAVLAGPSAAAQRTLAKVKFTVDPACVATNQANVSLNFLIAKFSGPDAQLIPGGGNTVNFNAAGLTANVTPSNIALSPSSVAEGVAGSFVGFLSTTDADAGDTFTYQLMSTCGANNNNLFEIPANANYLKLQNLVSANFANTPYSVCVRSTDNYFAFVDKMLTVQVVQGNLAPIAVDDGTPTPIVVKGPTLIDVMGNDSDPNGNGTIVVNTVTNGTHGIVINNGINVTYVATDPNYLNLDTFSYNIKDTGGLTSGANVTVDIKRDKAPGNCNGQGGLDAGDLTAWGLEFFDGDDNSKWYHTPNSIGGGTFDGSPYGCNANKNSQIDAGDLTCIGILYFGGVCNPAVVAASSTTTASLAVSSDLSAAPGATIDVPILLTSAGNHVSAAAFAVDFDASVLAFDATDANGDGLPDGVSLNIPSGLFTMVNYNATESRIEILVTGMALPFPQLADGTLATVKLMVNADASSSETAIQIASGSLGNDEGMPVPLEVTDGAVQISVTGQSQLNRLYLPTIQK